MLIHPWDSAGPDEWRDWLGTTAPFGQLAVTNSDPGEAPLVVPTHAVIEGTDLLVHLARPNPVWSHIAAHPRVLFTVVGDYAYIPSTWRAKAGGPDEDGVPTSYYATVQFTCDATTIADAEEKADLLRTQLRHLQPEGDHADVDVHKEPYGRMLPGILGLRLHVVDVVAKFKYDDHNPVEHRRRVTERLLDRADLNDPGAAAQQSRRLEERGVWTAGDRRS
jgi:transcriptional regulator